MAQNSKNSNSPSPPSPPSAEPYSRGSAFADALSKAAASKKTPDLPLSSTPAPSSKPSVSPSASSASVSSAPPGSLPPLLDDGMKFTLESSQSYESFRQMHLIRGHTWNALRCLVQTVVVSLNAHLGYFHEFGDSILTFDQQNNTSGREQTKKPPTAMEIGSGLGDLFMLCKQKLPDLIQTDPDSDIASACRKLTKVHTNQLKFNELPQKLSPDSTNYIMGMSVFDRMSPSELCSWASLAVPPLKKGGDGFVVHFSDFSTSPSYANYIVKDNPTAVVLPDILLEDQIQVRLFSRGDINAILSRWASDPEKAPLVEVLKNHLASPQFTDGALWQYGPKICKELTEIGLSSRVMVLDEYYQYVVRTALTGAGMHCLVHDVVQKDVWIDRSLHMNTIFPENEKCNFFFNNRGRPTQSSVRFNPTDHGLAFFSKPVLERCRLLLTIAAVNDTEQTLTTLHKLRPALLGAAGGPPVRLPLPPLASRLSRFIRRA